MRIVSLSLKNFRCFSSVDLDVESSVVLLHGPNGSGKTSILEALHYGCYLRSFKTHLPREIAQTKSDGFGLAVGLASTNSFDTLQVNFSRNKKTVKLNQQPVGSYKELYDVYKVVTITEDDLLMIQGAPSGRRSFIDHMVLLVDPEYAILLKKYRQILDNRTALIASGKNDPESYELWTDQLLKTSTKLQKARIAVLENLEKEVQILIKQVMSEGTLSITYEYARPYSNIADITTTKDLLIRYPSLPNHEMMQKRTLFGAHLDDFSITFQGKSCRTYASRGQQKLLIFLLKLAHVKSLREANASSGVILLVDDFMTDFDQERAEALVPLMVSLPTQLIVTTPVEELVKNKLKAYKTQSVNVGALEYI